MKSRSDRKKEEPSGLSASGEPAQAGSNDSEVRHLIAVRAYELYRERGAVTGMISTTGWRPSKQSWATK